MQSIGTQYISFSIVRRQCISKLCYYSPFKSSCLIYANQTCPPILLIECSEMFYRTLTCSTGNCMEWINLLMQSCLLPTYLEQFGQRCLIKCMQPSGQNLADSMGNPLGSWFTGEGIHLEIWVVSETRIHMEIQRKFLNRSWNEREVSPNL